MKKRFSVFRKLCAAALAAVILLTAVAVLPATASRLEADSMYDMISEYQSYYLAHKDAIDTLARGMWNLEDSIKIFDYRIPMEDAGKVFRIAVNTHPELFYVCQSFSYRTINSGGVSYITRFEPTWGKRIYNSDGNYSGQTQIYSATTVLQMREEFHNRAQWYLDKVDDSMSDFEKALVLHDALVLNSSYLLTGETYDLMVDGRGKCYGYSEAYSYLLEQVGIKSEIIESDDMHHQWNKVLIGGKYYHVDVTWDDPVPDEIGFVQHKYFMLSDAAIAGLSPAHYGYVSEFASNDTRYDNANFHRINTRFCKVGDTYYAVDNHSKGNSSTGRSLLRYNIATDRFSTVESYDHEYWDAGDGYVYSDMYMALDEQDGYLYFNTENKVYVYDTRTSQKSVFASNTYSHAFYGVRVKDNKVYAVLADEPLTTGTLQYVGDCLARAPEPTTEEPTTEAPTPAPLFTNGYYLIRPNWDLQAISPINRFWNDPGTPNEFTLHTTLAEGDRIKVVKLEYDRITEWFPDGYGNEYVVDARHAGETTIRFSPQHHDDWAEFGGYFTLPVTVEPTTEEPTTEEPTTEEPTTEEPTTEEPTTEEPTTEEPTTEEPTTEEPTTEEPTTEEPTTEEPTTEEPTTEEPTTVAPTTIPYPEDVYVVAGSPGSIFHEVWDGTNEDNRMFRAGDVYVRSYTVSGPMRDIQLKVVRNGSVWYGDETQNNIVFHMTGAGSFTVIFDPDAEQVTITGAKVTFDDRLEVEKVCVAGNGEGEWLFGADWDYEFPANYMTEVADGVWEKTYENIGDAFSRQFKFALNGSWARSFGGSFIDSGTVTPAVYDGGNITFDTEYEKQSVKLQLDLRDFDFITKEGATFTVTIEETPVPTQEPTTEEPTPAPTTVPAPTDVYVVAGSPDTVFGEEWDGDRTANRMTYADGAYTRTFTVDGAMKNIQLKVVKNGDDWFGTATGNNIVFHMMGAGDFTVTFHPDTQIITVTGDQVAFSDKLEAESVIVAGNGEAEWLCGENWEYDSDINAMTQIADGIWRRTYQNIGDAFCRQCKFAVNGSELLCFGGSFTDSGVVTPAVFGGNSITFDTEYDCQTVKLQLDLRNFDFVTKEGAKFTVTIEETAIPTEEPTTEEPTTEEPTTAEPTTAEPTTVELTTEEPTTEELTTAEPTTEEPTEPPLDPGDVDGDGVITINDATDIQRFLAEYGALTEAQRRAADVNRDGKVSIKDATHLQRYLAEFITIIG